MKFWPNQVDNGRFPLSESAFSFFQTAKYFVFKHRNCLLLSTQKFLLKTTLKTSLIRCKNSVLNVWRLITKNGSVFMCLNIPKLRLSKGQRPD